MNLSDIVDPTLKAGYKHVNVFKNGTFRAQAYGGKKTQAGHAWYGPVRKTAVEAAQDYLDYINTKPPLTIDDLRNPKRKSGFDHVNSNGPKDSWRAEDRMGGNHGSGPPVDAWRGPTRKTPDQAAQDYCDYINAQRASNPSVPSAAVSPRLKTAGHTGKRDPIADDPEVQAALGVLRDARGHRQGRQGYVYLIYEMQPGGGLRYGKIGYSTNPEARVAELQTGNPRPLKLGYAMPGTMDDERRLHDKYSNLNVLQEWFEITKELILEFPANTQVK